MKQRSKLAHFWPVQRSLRASILAQAVDDFGQRLDLRAIAELGGLFPVANDLEIGHFFEPVEHRRVLGIVDLLPAGVVIPALHVADLQRPRKVLLQERNVLEERAAPADSWCRWRRRRACPIAAPAPGRPASFRCPCPASTIRWRLSAMADSTASAISTWPGAKFILGMPLGEHSVPGKELTRARRAGLDGHRDSSILTYCTIAALACVHDTADVSMAADDRPSTQSY